MVWCSPGWWVDYLGGYLFNWFCLGWSLTDLVFYLKAGPGWLFGKGFRLCFLNWWLIFWLSWLA